MRDHETRFYACVARQKCRQPFALVRIHQSINAALADAHEIGERNRGIIERERERRAVKISTGDDVAAVSKHEWIIGRRRGFDRQNLFAMSENVADRAVHLRHATHGAVDRKSTRLNSSHSQISYAVFCLTKKKNRIEVIASKRVQN